MNPKTLTLEELLDWLYMLSKSQEPTTPTTITDINVKDSDLGRVITLSTLAEQALIEILDHNDL